MPSRAQRCSLIKYVVVPVLICLGVLLQERPRAFAQAREAQGPANAIPRIQRIELLNGLRVVAIERPGEVAVINFLVRAGSFSDPGDKAGVANLTAQGLCFANAKLPFQRWKDELEFLQARIEAHVTTDSTVFQAQVPSSGVEAVLALFARLAIQPIYTPEGVERIKSELGSQRLTRSQPHALGQSHLAELI